MTKAQIRSRVIAYFAWRFSVPASSFDDDTKVRQRFKSAAAWRALADTFNNTDWMETIGVLLKQRDMDKQKTIGDLVTLIYDKQPNP